MQQVFKIQQHVVAVMVLRSLISVRITSKRGSTLFTGSQRSHPLRGCAWKSVFVVCWK